MNHPDGGIRRQPHPGSLSLIKALLVTIPLIPVRNTVSPAFLFQALNQDQVFPLNNVIGRLTKEYF
jgi:hypothetical protein